MTLLPNKRTWIEGVNICTYLGGQVEESENNDDFNFSILIRERCKKKSGNSFFSLIDIMVIYYGGSIIMVDT